ncbi:MAG: reverse transcriptase-like protein [Richelia sp. RM2_1_2]|nr:reverse transcriptase-like protein [Richelia sp. RM2_1_2]
MTILPNEFYFDGGLSRLDATSVMEVAVVCAKSKEKFLFHQGTSNEAEWIALLTAVETAIEQHVKDPIFIGDSQLVVEQAKGNWQIKAVHLYKYKYILDCLSDKFTNMSFKWVPRKNNLAGDFLEKQK